MKKNKEKREPLMYIHQPVFTQQAANMQQSYHVKNDIREQINDLAKEESKKKRRKPVSEETTDIEMDSIKSERIMEEMSSEKKEEEAEQKKKRPAWMAIKQVKPFKEMNLSEKLEHLQNQFIPYPCEFYCAGKSFKGMLIDLKEKELHVKTFKDEFITILRKDLKNVRLIGPK